MAKYADASGLVYDYGTNPSLNADKIKGMTQVPDTTPTGSNLYKPTTLPSGLQGYTDPQGNFSTTLNSSNLTQTPSPNFPPAPTTSDVSGLLSGGQATIDALNKFFTTPPPSTADAYTAAYGTSGLDQKNQDVLTQNTAVKQAQDKLAGINAQLAGITAEGQAIPIQAQQNAEGRGITAAGLAPITAGQLRMNALKALPLQAQALGAQAEVAAAQGNQQLAQQALQMAQSKFDTIFKLKSEDATNTYNYQKDVRNHIWDVATQQEKERLTQQQKIADQNYNTWKNIIDDAQAKVGTLMSTQPELAAKIATRIGQSIGINDKTLASDVAKLIAQAQPTKTLNTQVVEIGGRKLLIDSTTGNTIKDLGIISNKPIIGQSITTINGKPLTDAQSTTLGYAQRMNDAHSIITDLGNKFTGLGNYISGSSLFPNIFKSEDRQKYEQAQRNFINAVLRKESGAAISPSEFDSAAKQYFPQPGDGQTVIEQKTANRQRAISNFAGSANTPLSAITGNIENKTGGDYNAYLKAIGQ